MNIPEKVLESKDLYDDTILPYSFNMTLKRLQCLECKMAKISELYRNTEYNTMNWYLSITMKNENKPSKIATINGVSVLFGRIIVIRNWYICDVCQPLVHTALYNF